MKNKKVQIGSVDPTWEEFLKFVVRHEENAREYNYHTKIWDRTVEHYRSSLKNADRKTKKCYIFILKFLFGNFVRY